MIMYGLRFDHYPLSLIQLIGLHNHAELRISIIASARVLVVFTELLVSIFFVDIDYVTENPIIF